MIVLLPGYNILPWSQDFNEKLSSISQFLKQKYEMDTYLVFIDDGSTKLGTTLDKHISNLKKIQHCKIITARHHLNRGQGAALMTALKIGRDILNGDYFVTLDSDGQHNPLNVISMLDTLKKQNLNIIFGNRFGAAKQYINQIPTFRKTILRLAVNFEKYITGLNLSDAHNGFRLFDRKAANILEIQQDRMAHATEIKKLIYKHGLAYGEATVEIIYDKQSLQNGQKNGNAINIIQELIREKVF